MKKLIAKGKDIDGDTLEFEIENGMLDCWSERLTELNVPEGVTHIRCYDNQLTELKIPEGVKVVNCWYNQLTELIIPMGVERVFCHDNKITHMELPDSVTYLQCDKKVTGLEMYVGKVRMRLR